MNITVEEIYSAFIQAHVNFVGLMGAEKVTVTDQYTDPKLIEARKMVTDLLDFFDRVNVPFTEKQSNLIATLRQNYDEMDKKYDN